MFSTTLNVTINRSKVSPPDTLTFPQSDPFSFNEHVPGSHERSVRFTRRFSIIISKRSSFPFPGHLHGVCVCRLYTGYFLFNFRTTTLAVFRSQHVRAAQLHMAHR